MLKGTKIQNRIMKLTTKGMLLPVFCRQFYVCAGQGFPAFIMSIESADRDFEIFYCLWIQEEVNGAFEGAFFALIFKEKE